MVSSAAAVVITSSVVTATMVVIISVVIPVVVMLLISVSAKGWGLIVESIGGLLTIRRRRAVRQVSSKRGRSRETIVPIVGGRKTAKVHLSWGWVVHVHLWGHAAGGTTVRRKIWHVTGTRRQNTQCFHGLSLSGQGVLLLLTKTAYRRHGGKKLVKAIFAHGRQ